MISFVNGTNHIIEEKPSVQYTDSLTLKAIAINIFYLCIKYFFEALMVKRTLLLLM